MIGRFVRLARPEIAHHRELVAAEPGHGVAGCSEGARTGGDLAQEPIAAPVTERVVHDLEVVEVDEQHEHVGEFAAELAPEGQFQVVEEQGPVRQIP